MSSPAPRALRRSSLRPIAAIPLAVLALLGACGPSSSSTPDAKVGGPHDGLPVGSPCDDALDCGSPVAPECLTKIKPLEMLAGVPAELADLGLEFPNGYCSTVLDCTGDADCYTMGACYRPFREVTADTLRQLEPPLMVSTGSLDFLPTYGVCMRPCTTAGDCEVGQICEPPLNDLVSLVPGAINDRSFCVPDPDCPEAGCTAGACSPNPCMNDGTCTESGSSYTCACPDGFSGMNCETAAQPRDRVIGQSCEIDAQCNVPGTARCLTEVHPLEDTLPSSSPLSQIGLDFARGYCSNEIGCASDIQCGAGGKCMAPFREVTAETFRELEVPLSLPAGALDFLGSYGVCLRSCVDTFDCFADQTCQYAMADFIALVPGSVNDKTFCVPHDDCDVCDPNAHCEVDANDNGRCECNPGYEGTAGLTCAPTGRGACADTPCENGGTCTDGPDTTYTCACPAGYEGTNCQIVAACAPNPCRNDGVCSGNGSGGFTCTCSGGWSGPTCESTTMCPILPEPTNGGVTVTNQGVGGVATYTCDAGFERQGAATRTCGSDGNWSGSAPTCVPAQGACASAPCMHGGVCTPGSGSNFTCDCAGTGHTGTTCQTPVNCGGLGTITNGTISTSPPSSTTFGTVATYACNSGYTLSGNPTRTCQANASWSGTAPTCVASSCGTHTDVVYRLTATFAIRNTPAGAGNQTFTGLTNNATTPPFVEGNGNSTPFTGGGTFAQGFARLRFTNNASGQPTTGTVRLVELYLPLEFTQTAGATLYANNDHSVGILSNPGSLTNCGGGDATCMNHAPTVNRTCASNASGSLTGTSLTWGSCTPAFPTDSTRWRYTNARGVTGAGCASSYVQYGNNTTSSILVPASGKGDAYQVYNQQLSPITFSGTNYLTATWTMAEYQIPNGTGQSNTWVTITGATPIGTDCGSTPGTDLVCNVQ